jgi:hypothetical protein
MLSGLTMKTPNQRFIEDCAGHVLLTTTLDRTANAADL